MRHLILVVLSVCLFPFASTDQKNTCLPETQLPISELLAPNAENSMVCGVIDSFHEMNLDNLPKAYGFFEPSSEPIATNNLHQSEWLPEAKFGILLHFDSPSKSSDWYACGFHNDKRPAHINHLKKNGHPSDIACENVMCDSNPNQLDPTARAKVYNKLRTEELAFPTGESYKYRPQIDNNLKLNYINQA